MEGIGKRIKKRRLELDLTQEELAKKLGYSHKSSIGKIENGQTDITQSKVVEFAHALNTTVAYLMGWEDDERLRQFAQNAVLFNELNSLWEQMNDDQKRTFLSLGRALIGTMRQHND